MPRIPLIEDLTSEPIPPGSSILVEYEPASQWYNASVSIGAGWLQNGGRVLYGAMAQSPDNVRLQFKRLGLDTDTLEIEDRLRIWDWYTATLGQKSKEKLAADSLKVSELSIWFAKEAARQSADPNLLRIFDNISTLARFNDEKSWVELFLTRVIPGASLWRSTTIRGVMKAVHSEWVYMQFEGANDAIVDLKLMEVGKEVKNFMRIRTMRNVPHSSEWRSLKISEKFEVTLGN